MAHVYSVIRACVAGDTHVQVGALSMAVCISGDACAPVEPDTIAKLSTQFGRAGLIVGRDGEAHGTVVAGFSGMGRSLAYCLLRD